MGSKAFTLINRCVDTRISILEIGSGYLQKHSGDGSTQFFSDFVQANLDSYFYSIDTNKDMYEWNEKQKAARGLERVHFYNGNYKKVLADLNTKFDFIYLDNFDYEPPGCEDHDWMVEQKKSYLNDYNIELNNANSAAAHLEQTEFVLNFVKDKCMIVFDDTFLIEQTHTHAYNIEQGKKKGFTYPDRGWYGKGATAVPFLIDKGWKAIDSFLLFGRDDYVALKNF